VFVCVNSKQFKSVLCSSNPFISRETFEIVHHCSFKLQEEEEVKKRKGGGRGEDLALIFLTE
jgi:hypothetical protein